MPPRPSLLTISYLPTRRLARVITACPLQAAHALPLPSVARAPAWAHPEANSSPSPPRRRPEPPTHCVPPHCPTARDAPHRAPRSPPPCCLESNCETATVWRAPESKCPPPGNREQRWRVSQGWRCRESRCRRRRLSLLHPRFPPRNRAAG